jgi:hypothetical protein
MSCRPWRRQPTCGDDRATLGADDGCASRWPRSAIAAIYYGATSAKESARTSGVAELRLANGLVLLAKFDGDFAAHSSTYAGRARSDTGGKSSARNLPMPSVEHFRMALRAQLNRAQKRGLSHIDVKAGDLLRRLGGSQAYPLRIPSCCEAMYAEKRAGDVIITRPPEGKGATLTIRYKLPRKADA